MLTALYELEVLKFIDFFSILSSSNMAHGREKYYNKNFLSKKIFQKIKEALRSLDYDSYQVWEEVTQYSNYRKQKLFRRDVLIDQMIRIIMPYLRRSSDYEKAWQNLIKKAAEALTTNGKMLVDYEWNKSKCTEEADTMKVDELNLKKIYIPRASSTSWNHFDARTDRILVYTKLH